MIRDGSDEKVRPRQVHIQRQACCFEKELADSATEHKRSTIMNEMHCMIRDASVEKVRPREVHRQRQA